MIRDHWRELAFWRWWWQNRVPFGAKAVLAVIVLAALVGGGWFASGGLPSAGASDKRSVTLVSTLERVVTLRGKERVLVRRVPVVRTVYVPNRAAAPKTVGRATTVLVTRTFYRTVSTAGKKQPARTVSRVVTVTKTRPVTVTSTKTVPQWRVVSVVQKPSTVTVTVTTP